MPDTNRKLWLTVAWLGSHSIKHRLLPSLLSPQSHRMKSIYIYVWPPPHSEMTAAYIAMALQAPPWPFCPLPIHSYSPLLVFPHQAPLLSSATSYGRDNCSHLIVSTGWKTEVGLSRDPPALNQ